jgi:signal transduction histidine kinase/TolB-like protein/FixJ family two-component response regulator
MLDAGWGAGMWRSIFRAVWSGRFTTHVASAFRVAVPGHSPGRLTVKQPFAPTRDAGKPPDPLYQAQKMESLGRLTGGVAHDFNNLLTVVLGNATALRVSAEARGDAQAARRAEMIERAAERGGRLAGQLLAYSRKQMLRPETVSVYRIISATSELLAQAAGESVRIRLHTEPALWDCHVDPAQLESAMLNLVMNARDAMPVGGSITIACHNHLQPRLPAGRPAGGYVRIDVQDTGAGIAADLLEQVFEPFFTTKPIGRGSGLGLSQVHGFAGQSGGWVDLSSRVGSGTMVSLFLPSVSGRESFFLPDPQAATSARRSQTVLVVEPDSDLRALAGETLTGCGYRPLTAENGSAALAHLVSDEPIDLLLTEAKLPGGVSGIELARSASQVRHALRVLITSDVSKDPAGGDKRFEFLMKPYRPSDLARVVGAVLTSDTFSVETEELFADARARTLQAGPPKVNIGAAAGSDVADVPLSGVTSKAIRLGVLPFRTIGSGTDTAYSLGFAEELTTAFARFRPIECVAPASVASLADAVDRQGKRWRQLDLDFLVEGSFRKKGNEIRVLLRLINMRGSGEISWGRRFDSLVPDVLNLQDRIASETAAQVAPEMVLWQGQKAASRPQVDPTAYDLMLRAIPAIYRLDEAGFRKAGALLEQSLALDPTNAGCHSWLAHWYLFLLGQGLATDATADADRADTLSQQAVILDPSDARGFTVAGHVRAFLYKDAKAALWLHEHAIALNPSLAMAWCYSGLAYSYLGQHDEAIGRIQRAQLLSPYDPHSFLFDMALTMPFLLTGQYEASVRVGRRARDLHPGLSSTYKGLLAALGHIGARREAAEIRKVLFELEPGFSVRSALARSPLLRSEDRDRYAEGLRLAGIPERTRPERRLADRSEGVGSYWR